MRKIVPVILTLMFPGLTACSGTSTQTTSNVTSNGNNHPTSVSNNHTSNQ